MFVNQRLHIMPSRARCTLRYASGWRVVLGGSLLVRGGSASCGTDELESCEGRVVESPSSDAISMMASPLRVLEV